MTKEQRDKFLNEFRNTPDCQYVREEIATYMQEVESVLSIPNNVMDSETPDRIAMETIGKRIASRYLNKLLLKLLPDEVVIKTKRIIK